MTLTEISKLRLKSQGIAGTSFKTAKEVVAWMGAMQAQDSNMSKWAVGLRLSGATETLIESAISSGEIIRTHLMRPTWHLVSSDDVYWMLKLTAPQIIASSKTRWKQLELSESLFQKSFKIIEQALEGGKHTTRDQLLGELKKEGISTTEQRSSHILLRAELEGLICSGAMKGKQSTYALLEERVTKQQTFNKDEAVAELTKRYFKSHGPATLQDFIWWSGLSVSDAKKGFEVVKKSFISETIGTQTFWRSESTNFDEIKKDLTYLLPAYDEFLISYKDRSPSISSDYLSTTISNNGIFWPVIVINSKVEGIWKRTIKKDKVLIETSMFQAPGKGLPERIKSSSKSYGHFLNLEVEVI